MDATILNRKGARKAQDIPKEVLALLNAGEIETVNLTEWLAVNHLTLINTVFPKLGIGKTLINTIEEELSKEKKPSTMNTTKLVGKILYKSYKDSNEFKDIYKKLAIHTSDSIRCYAPFLISLDEKLSIEQKLEKSKGLVADTHFGIREVVWIALRPEIAIHLDKSIAFLTDWTLHTDENIRRFTTESTRPRGVWCKHIDSLKENPQQALPILENLKSDTSKYVQDSVGNWLNDASKTKPNFVVELCNRWKEESSTKETEKIIKRARRTIDKK